MKYLVSDSLNNYSIGVSAHTNPFVDPITDYPKVYIAKKGYNKLGFALAMLHLHQQIKLHPKVAANYYALANGLYSTSFYGNSWQQISYDWSSYDFGRPAKYYYDGDYVKTSAALRYYLKARALSTNPEFRARCTFMAAKCRQKQWTAPQFDYQSYSKARYRLYEKKDEQYRRHLLSSSYFDELRTNYRHTKFFRQAVGECSYLRDYIKVSKR